MTQDMGAPATPSGSRADAPSQQAVSAVPASIPSAGVEVIDIPTFHARLKAQGVPNPNHCAFVCPVCYTVQSMASLVAAGASTDSAERMVGFSCEGRLRNAGPWPRKPTAARRLVRGCDWTLGGLFHIHQLEVCDGERTHPRFNLASPYEAQKLAQAMSAGTAEKPQAAQGDSPPARSEGCAQ